MRTTLDSLAEMAAALWPTRSASLTVHGWQTPATALMTDADDPDGAPLALASAEAPDAAVAALVTTLRAMARERAAVLLAAAGEPQPADRGVRRGARLSDDALRHVALDVLRAEGVTAASTLRRVAVAIVDAIRQAERRADERDDVLIAALAHLDESADVSARDTIDAIAIDLGEALAELRRDLRDGREDEHADHAAAFRRLGALALRGAAAAGRRAMGAR